MPASDSTCSLGRYMEYALWLSGSPYTVDEVHDSPEEVFINHQPPPGAKSVSPPSAAMSVPVPPPAAKSVPPTEARFTPLPMALPNPPVPNLELMDTAKPTEILAPVISPEPAPQLRPPVSAPCQRFPVSAPRQHFPVPASLGPVPSVLASPEPVPTVPASPGSVHPWPMLTERPQESSSRAPTRVLPEEEGP